MCITTPANGTRSAELPNNEAQLVHRAQQGDRDAVEFLASRSRPKLVHLLTGRLGCRADAEDVAQQALMRALQRIDQHDGRRPFFAWLYRIALRIVIDHHRKRRPESGLETRDLCDPSTETAEKAATDAELHDNLWLVARRVLSADQHSALWLRYVEGFSVQEIAHALDRTKISTRVLLHRARRRLAPHLLDMAESSVPSKPGEVS